MFTDIKLHAKDMVTGISCS